MSDAARAEAEARYPWGRVAWCIGEAGEIRDAFVAGATWQAAQPVAMSREHAEARLEAVLAGLRTLLDEADDTDGARRSMTLDGITQRIRGIVGEATT